MCLSARTRAQTYILYKRYTWKIEKVVEHEHRVDGGGGGGGGGYQEHTAVDVWYKRKGVERNKTGGGGGGGGGSRGLAWSQLISACQPRRSVSGLWSFSKHFSVNCYN